MRSQSMRLPALWIALAMVMSCASVRVQTDYDPNADFAALRTFRWMEYKQTGNPRIDDDLLHQRVRHAVDARLVAKGLAKVETEPDFWIIEYVVIEQKIDVDTYVSSYGYRRGPVYTETYVREYDVGTLILDFVDAKSRRLLWRGSGEARLHENVTPEKRSARVNAVVEKVLARFPPAAPN